MKLQNLQNPSNPGEAAMGSPLRSPDPLPLPPPAKSPARRGEAGNREEEPMASPRRSPLRLLAKSSAGREEAGDEKEEAMDSPLRSPLRSAAEGLTPPPALPPPPHNTPEKAPSQAAMAVASRLARDDLATMVSKMVAGGGGGGGGAAAVEAGERGFRVVPGALRRATGRRVAVGLRISTAVLCLVSFAVMAADKTQGWAGDSFDRYQEYRYCLSVTVITFVYSGFQVYAEVHHMITRKFLIRRPISYYFDFLMDQILAYLLISASSAAASRNDVWVTRFGSDEFTDRISASVSMSFLAFITLALSSLISAYNLFSWHF